MRLEDRFRPGLHERMRGPLEGSGPPRGRLEDAVSGWVEYVARRPATARILLREVNAAGAVSISVTPSSIEAWIAATEASSSVPPHIQPPIAHVPRPTADA